MKKIVALLLLFSLSYSAIGQADAIATSADIQKFLKTKTYVVFDTNIFGSYNSAIKKAVQNYWTLTPVEFIDMKQFKKLKGSYRNSFIIRNKVNFEKDKSNTSYTFLSVLLGSNKGSMSSMPDLISFPLSYYNVDYDKYHYKMGAIMKFMQNHIILTRDNPDVISKKNVLAYYNKNTSDLQGKTLYVIKEELDKSVNTNSKIKQYYSGKVVITTAEEIEKIIAKKDPDAVFLHKVGPSSKDDKLRIFKLIMGASDGKLYYFNWHKFKKGKRNDAFLASDFKKMGS